MQLKNLLILASLTVASAGKNKGKGRSQTFGELNDAIRPFYRKCVYKNCIKPNADMFGEICLELKSNCRDPEYRQREGYSSKRDCKLDKHVMDICQGDLDASEKLVLKNCKDDCYQINVAVATVWSENNDEGEDDK